MWSRRGILHLLGVTAASAALAGCGFHPMYGNANVNTAGVSVDKQMAGIRIEPIANRLGQQLHNALRDRMNPLGQPSSAQYSLEVNLTERTYGALTKSDLSATRRNVELNAFIYLRDLSGNMLLSDKQVITTGYDEFDDPLNDLSALEDAQRRGALQLADMIATRVSVYLTSGTAAPVIPQTGPVQEPPGAWAY